MSKTANKPRNWRKMIDEDEIVANFPRKPSADDVIDLYQKAKALKSNRLLEIVKYFSANR